MRGKLLLGLLIFSLLGLSSCGSAWHYVGAPNEVSFSNGWKSYPDNAFTPARFMKDGNGFIHLEGLLSPSVPMAKSVAFVLPEKYRPGANLDYCVSGASGTGLVLCRARVYTSGYVFLESTTNVAIVSISGIIFKAEK